MKVRVCDTIQGDRTYSGQIKDRIAKLINLKYDVFIACLDRYSNFKVYAVYEINMKKFSYWIF